MNKVTILKSRLSNSGGIEKYTLRIAQAFAEKQCEVTVLTTNCEKLNPSWKFKVVNFPSCSNISFIHLLQFDKLCQEWIRNNPGEIIFGLDRNCSQTHYRAGNGVHAEYLKKREDTDSFFKRLSFKINPLHRTILNLEKRAYENPGLQTLFTNSYMVRDEVLKHYQTDPNKLCVLHNGVEWNEMAAEFKEWPNKQAETLVYLGLDPSAFHFLFIGKGFRRKGLKYLLEALACINDHHFQLSVVGHDKEMETFKQMAEKLGLGKRVLFFGHRSDVLNFYKACDVLVIPSTYDPFANVTVEALAMGLFVISSKANGGAEILTSTSGKVIDNLFDRNSMIEALRAGFSHVKSPHSAYEIRQSVQHLDFTSQLNVLVDKTLDRKGT